MNTDEVGCGKTTYIVGEWWRGLDIHFNSNIAGTFYIHRSVTLYVYRECLIERITVHHGQYHGRQQVFNGRDLSCLFGILSGNIN